MATKKELTQEEKLQRANEILTRNNEYLERENLKLECKVDKLEDHIKLLENDIEYLKSVNASLNRNIFKTFIRIFGKEEQQDNNKITRQILKGPNYYEK